MNNFFALHYCFHYHLSQTHRNRANTCGGASGTSHNLTLQSHFSPRNGIFTVNAGKPRYLLPLFSVSYVTTVARCGGF